MYLKNIEISSIVSILLFFVWSFSYPIPQNRFSSTGLTTCDQEHRAQSVPPTSESHNKLTSGFPLTPCRTATSEHSPRFILIVYIIVIIQKSTSFNCITWTWQWGTVVLLGVLRNSGKGRICIVFHTSWLIGQWKFLIFQLPNPSFKVWIHAPSRDPFIIVGKNPNFFIKRGLAFLNKKWTIQGL